ncbi:Mut7-C RNAse domain-containing protein [Haloferacaceae archaeon DSL9]
MTADIDADSSTRPPVLADVMLGSLARHLRMCGYDAAYALDRGAEADDRLLDLAKTEGRTVLTRDTQLAARAEPSVLLERRDLTGQLQELVDAGFRLEVASAPRYCGACNGRLERPPPGIERPDYVPAEPEARQCRDCGQWFWRGGHWEDVERRIDALDAGDQPTASGTD